MIGSGPNRAATSDPRTAAPYPTRATAVPRGVDEARKPAEDESEREGGAPGLDQQLRTALAERRWPQAISAAFALGTHDENVLADMIFSAAHPERQGRVIASHEKTLAQEWRRIRDTLVRPALQRLAEGSRPPLTSTTPYISFGPRANRSSVSTRSLAILQDICVRAGLPGLLITSTSRTPADQARIMYANLERHGVAAQKALYARPGERVIDVYVAGKKAGLSKDKILSDMTAEILLLGPSSVSKHTADPARLNVIDIAPSSIRNKRSFELVVRADPRISRFLTPSSSDPAYHLEIPQ